MHTSPRNELSKAQHWILLSTFLRLSREKKCRLINDYDVEIDLNFFFFFSFRSLNCVRFFFGISFNEASSPFTSLIGHAIVNTIKQYYAIQLVNFEPMPSLLLFYQQNIQFHNHNNMWATHTHISHMPVSGPPAININQKRQMIPRSWNIHQNITQV